MKLLMQTYNLCVMSKILKIVLMLIFCACSSEHSKMAVDIERIPVEVHKVTSDASLFIEKIEIVPLETTDSSLISGYKKTIYDKNMDIYAIYGKKQVVQTFSGKGEFIGSSRKMKGEGPQEYHMAVDIKFNPYLKGIDLLSPYGMIYTYSPTFELIAKRTIKTEFYFDALMALSADDYVFTVPSIWTDQEVTFANLKTQQVEVANYSGTISSDNTMDRECFYKNDDNLYFVPRGVNYNFYQIDEKKKELIPIIYLDFGDSEIKEKGLPGVAVGKRTGTEKTKTDSERNKLSKEIRQRAQFIRESAFVVPLVKFFNDDYVYIYFAKGKTGFGGNYIYNRKKKKGFLLNEGKPFIMQPCFGIVDNVLMSIADPYYVSRLVDTRLMSPEEISKMERLNEDDNPVILKYYLRK